MVHNLVVVSVDDIETALQMSDDAFQLKYHFEKPPLKCLIVLYCRSGKRADRAGRLLRDKFGYQK